MLVNDAVPTGSSAVVSLVQGPQHAASFSLNSNGSFTYQPIADYAGSDSFIYKFTAGATESNTATVTLTIANDPPAALDDEYFLPAASPLVIPATQGVLVNDTDADGDPLTALLVSPPSTGSLLLNLDGGFTYNYPANLSGSVTFTYKANDGSISGNTATVTLTVLPDNPPVSVADQYQLAVDSPVTVPGSGGVLANDTDADSDPLTAVLVAPPAVGTLTLNTDGSFTFDFPTDLVGPVTFSYKANDGTVSGNTATVTLTREAIVAVRGSTLHVIGTAGPDTVRLRPAPRGAITVELNTLGGPIQQTLGPVAPATKFSLVNVRLGDGDDSLDATKLKVPVRVVGGVGSDTIRTGPVADQIFGDEADGTGNGNNVIAVGNGTNYVLVGDGNNTIETGRAADVIIAGNGRNYVFSGSGNDTVTVGTGGSLIDAGGGNDVVKAGGGSNYLLGGAGRDVLQGASGADVIDGGLGNDLIVGGLGDDRLNGRAGNDILFDGQVTMINQAVDTLASLLASYVPTRLNSLVGISQRIAVTYDAPAADMLIGDTGIDWFWSNDLLDLHDRKTNEPLRAVN